MKDNHHIDEVDKQILKYLIENTRMPFTEIAKKMKVSAGTIHVRVKKLEDSGIIRGTSLHIDYSRMGYNFIAYIGVILNKSKQIRTVLKQLEEIPNVTVVHIISGKYNLFCKVRARDTEEAKEVIYQIDEIEDVMRTETMISLEEAINDKNRLMKSIFSLGE